MEFRKTSSLEADLALLEEYNAKGPEYFAMNGVTAFQYQDGRTDDIAITETIRAYIRDNSHIPVLAYEDVEIRGGYVAGACVIWHDLGAQLADQAIQILQGANPGEMPWEYPRKYNLIFNLKKAAALGITIPEELLSAAYRVYTDYDGHFIGQEK